MRRSQRETRPIQRLEPSMRGQSYNNLQSKIKNIDGKTKVKRIKKTRFQEEVFKLEYVHNIISQSRSNKEEYATEYAMVIARTMD